MVKQIILDFPEIEVSIRANLREEDEPELCKIFWENLKKPVKLFCRHPVSTGEEFSGESRPPEHPVQTGTQARPLGRKKWLFTRIPAGSVVYAIFGGYGGVSLIYGPCTEPLPARGSVVGIVVEEDWENMLEAGKAVWNAQYRSHKPFIMYAKRGGAGK